MLQKKKRKRHEGRQLMVWAIRPRNTNTRGTMRVFGFGRIGMAMEGRVQKREGNFRRCGARCR